MEEKSTHATP